MPTILPGGEAGAQYFDRAALSTNIAPSSYTKFVLQKDDLRRYC
jgi:hypothetical protein